MNKNVQNKLKTYFSGKESLVSSLIQTEHIQREVLVPISAESCFLVDGEKSDASAQRG